MLLFILTVSRWLNEVTSYITSDRAVIIRTQYSLCQMKRTINPLLFCGSQDEMEPKIDQADHVYWRFSQHQLDGHNKKIEN